MKSSPPSIAVEKWTCYQEGRTQIVHLEWVGNVSPIIYDVPSKYFSRRCLCFAFIRRLLVINRRLSRIYFLCTKRTIEFYLATFCCFILYYLRRLNLKADLGRKKSLTLPNFDRHCREFKWRRNLAFSIINNNFFWEVYLSKLFLIINLN